MRESVPAKTEKPLETPDGRYVVVRGRLWRKTRPDLSEARRAELTRDLMAARRTIGQTDDPALRKEARGRVDHAKRALGERGPVWWTDGAPDLNRHLAKNTPYADWYASSAAARSGEQA